MILKDYFNQFRGALPPEFKGKVDGVLMSDLVKLNKWRNWRSGLTWEDKTLGVKLIGALDDCLTDNAGEEIYMPLDNKTKGSLPKDNGAQYYQTQLDCYELLLQSNKYRINGKAYLAYYYPLTLTVLSAKIDDSISGKINFPFGIDVYCLESSPDRAVKEITRAVEILKGKRPAPTLDCEWCKFGLLYPREEVK